MQVTVGCKSIPNALWNTLFEVFWQKNSSKKQIYIVAEIFILVTDSSINIRIQEEISKKQSVISVTCTNRNHKWIENLKNPRNHFEILIVLFFFFCFKVSQRIYFRGVSQQANVLNFSIFYGEQFICFNFLRGTRFCHKYISFHIVLHIKQEIV